MCVCLVLFLYCSNNQYCYTWLVNRSEPDIIVSIMSDVTVRALSNVIRDPSVNTRLSVLLLLHSTNSCV